MASQFQHLDPENDWSAPYRAWNMSWCPVRSRLRMLSWLRHYGLAYILVPEGEDFGPILRHFYDGWLGALQILLAENRKEIPDRILALAAMRRRRLDRLFVQRFSGEEWVTASRPIDVMRRLFWTLPGPGWGGGVFEMCSLGDGTYRTVVMWGAAIATNRIGEVAWQSSPSIAAPSAA